MHFWSQKGSFEDGSKIYIKCLCGMNNAKVRPLDCVCGCIFVIIYSFGNVIISKLLIYVFCKVCKFYIFLYVNFTTCKKLFGCCSEECRRLLGSYVDFQTVSFLNSSVL